ncbi:hypothetical protein K0M31_017504, partial [Melipona bicolor]
SLKVARTWVQVRGKCQKCKKRDDGFWSKGKRCTGSEGRLSGFGLIEILPRRGCETLIATSFLEAGKAPNEMREGGGGGGGSVGENPYD